MNDTLINYQPLNQSILTNNIIKEKEFRKTLINGHLNGNLTNIHGVFNNADSIYNFSMVDLRVMYDLKAAQIDYNSLPEVAHQFVIYKIEDIIPIVLYNNEPVSDNDVRLFLSTTPIEQDQLDAVTLITSTNDPLVNPLITTLGFSIYYMLYLPETSMLVLDEESYGNFTVQLDQENSKIHYYKYNNQIQDFQEIILDRETQLGTGLLDIWLDINTQTDSIDTIQYMLENRKSIVAVQENNEPVLDNPTNFDTGSLWFIKTVNEESN